AIRPQLIVELRAAATAPAAVRSGAGGVVAWFPCGLPAGPSTGTAIRDYHAHGIHAAAITAGNGAAVPSRPAHTVARQCRMPRAGRREREPRKGGIWPR